MNNLLLASCLLLATFQLYLSLSKVFHASLHNTESANL